MGRELLNRTLEKRDGADLAQLGRRPSISMAMAMP
jgi:hypothetical protein